MLHNLIADEQIRNIMEVVTSLPLQLGLLELVLLYLFLVVYV